VGAERSAQRAGRTVLVVDDEPDHRAATVQMLVRNGFTVLSAADGPSALALSRSHAGAIHLLVTDSMMAAMPGVELAEALRHQRPDITVIFVSEFAPNSFDAARPPALLHKPFGEAQLLEAVHRHLPD
jgi:CheY-like chemotaxis protein